ncbi:MAG TPA: response regulator [Methylomirabilota bacterium]|nr:response regulator [Methylomirabilota bacterium]
MSTTSAAILLVEDNEDDVFLMRRALKSAGIINPLIVAEDGQQAIDYLAGAGEFADRATHPLPAIVFLDLKLPFIRGHDVLSWIRQQPHLENLVVVILTSSNEPKDLKEAYRLGANSYVVKPPTSEQLLDLAKAFRWYWLRFNEFDPLSEVAPGSR